jgi:hypothetical protein
MLIRNRATNKKLFVAGAGLLALRGVLERFVDRNGHSTDTTDFFFGVMFGVGIGLLLLFVWRLGRGNRTPDPLH